MNELEVTSLPKLVLNLPRTHMPKKEANIIFTGEKIDDVGVGYIVSEFCLS